jgi:chromosome segregation ATPase
MKEACEQRVETIEKERRKEFQINLNSLKKESEEGLRSALDSLTTEHDERIQSLEYDLSWMKQQKDNVQENADKLKREIQYSRESVKDLNNSIKSKRVEATFNRLVLISKALSLQESLKKKDEEKVMTLEKMEGKFEQERQAIKKKIEILENQATTHNNKMKLICATLLNHRRDELLQHKIKSKDVSNKLDDIMERVKGFETKRQKVLEMMNSYEDGVRKVERQLQEHSQVSALQGGKVNLNHARKKRRLDEE